jgi:hypothetical protein
MDMFMTFVAERMPVHTRVEFPVNPSAAVQDVLSLAMLTDKDICMSVAAGVVLPNMPK